METIVKESEVEAPVRAVYNQWTQFEEFPNFVECVKEVRQVDDRHLRWTAEILGREIAWDAIIDEQVPDQRISWRSTAGQPLNGAVYFERRGDRRTHVRLVINYEPLGVTQIVADALGIVSSRIEGDLERFRSFIETRAAETGAWRGEIREGDRAATP